MNTDTTNIIRLCEVLDNEDDTGAGRIKVRIMPEDSDKQYVKDLPWCTPLLPMHVHIRPKVGETAMIILSNIGVSGGNRFYISPLISQPYTLNYDPFKYRSRCLLEGTQIDKAYPAPEMNPENEGNILDTEDIAIQGRQNCSVVLKDSELQLRCGFKQQPTGMSDNTMFFNREDLAYIQMRYRKLQDDKDRDFSSTINVVADRINLLSHDSKDYFTLNDRKELISDDELLKIIQKAHPMVYGDELVDFLKRLCNVILTHTHPFPMMPPSLTTDQESVLGTDLDSMLAQGIRVS